MKGPVLGELRRLPVKSVSVLFPERRIPLHSMLSSGGHSRETQPIYSWDGMSRGKSSFAVLQLTLSGSGRLETRAGAADVPEGTLMLVHVPSVHHYFLPPDRDHWEFVYLIVYGRELLRILLGVERRQGNVLALKDDSRVPGAFLRVLTALFSRSSDQTAFEISSLAYELCMSILLESFALPERPDAPRFEPLKRHLRDHLDVTIPVSEMADLVGLSRSHFTRLFKELEGVSPRDYIEDLRLKKALHLLYSQSMTVKEIAFACGIPDVNYFCRLFKKEMGMSPGEYRKSGF